MHDVLVEGAAPLLLALRPVLFALRAGDDLAQRRDRLEQQPPLLGLDLPLQFRHDLSPRVVAPLLDGRAIFREGGGNA